MIAYEYRVTWRREHDGRKRTRRYALLRNAMAFASFIRHASWDEVDPDGDIRGSILAENLERLGNPIEVQIERRTVGEWETL